MSNYFFIFVHKITHLTSLRNISSILFSTIKKNGRIGIRGLGVFKLVDFHQKLNFRGNLLLPPLKRVTFDEGLIDEENIATLSSEIEAQFHGNVDKLNKKIGAQFNRFLNYGMYDMKSFGRVKLMEDGKMIFEAGKSDELNKSARYLPAIELMPLDENKLTTDTNKLKGLGAIGGVKAEPLRNIKNNSSNSLWARLIVGISLLVILLAAIYLWSGLFDGSVNELKEGQEVTASVGLSSDDIQEELFDNDYQSLLTPDILKSGCVIITGTFKDKQNARSTYESIEAKGYVPYIEDFKNMTRVGVVFDCRDEDLDQYLHLVQQDLSPKAWYLRPDYTPKR